MLASELYKLKPLDLEDAVLQELRENTRQVEELQEVVSTELRNTTQRVEDASRQVGDLRVAVADNNRLVTSMLGKTRNQLKDASRQVGVLEEVEASQGTVASDLADVKHQLKQLQAAVLGIVRILTNSSGKK